MNLPISHNTALCKNKEEHIEHRAPQEVIQTVVIRHTSTYFYFYDFPFIFGLGLHIFLFLVKATVTKPDFPPGDQLSISNSD